MDSYRPIIDLAGEVCFQPTFWHIQKRINNLITKYLNYRKICDRLENLPQQFTNPQPQNWEQINWQDIKDSQIIGIELEVFLKILQGTFDTEAPIRRILWEARTIQQVIGELLEDEINHMSKFWGFGKWLYTIAPKSKNSLKGLKHLATTMNRMTGVLYWNSWTMTHKIKLIYSFSFVLRQMWSWSNGQTPDYLQSTFALSLISEEK